MTETELKVQQSKAMNSGLNARLGRKPGVLKVNVHGRFIDCQTIAEVSRLIKYWRG